MKLAIINKGNNSNWQSQQNFRTCQSHLSLDKRLSGLQTKLKFLSQVFRKNHLK